ncbi:MAG: methenyltetrahydromethanopterin cyclohydrolase [Pseudomonadota bacterium]|jgi:methenyltetrahydromethanopterin cyclohydrolase|uniref:Methenyltetrahydromethanopterin cyclohydrolase n=1 Tax=Methylophaga aminisulfidivorans MP TaxID=1026882 RepID=F5SXZ5_9GAMM|nr:MULTISPECIES: methenyltetrahydromethanopterin cyclohydrolase [Methylophaga]EGL54063.1 methenyltetrahydromethanopterin cyclohydrolase [Methylophaga aminisulfidivorans MP]MEC9413424.1 methenyltetrahydromethanopterin cyclohydrolase [Pseudomonadota bacterium]WVI85255.1 methenyltetrahydromethanopterin cyclohydrolase [Methylophaga thalassica]
MSTDISAKWTSVNAACQPLVDALIDNAEALQLEISTLSNGTRVVDAGINCTGGLEAGRLIGEICMGGLGTATLGTNSGFANWPWSVNVHAKTPVLSCLGSQYAGWSLSHKSEDSKFFALGSGPGRALAAREEIFKEFGYKDEAESTVIVLEVDSFPPVEVAEKVADNCGIKPENLTFILTPTSSLAGVMQIAIRVLEVAMHKAHELHFPLEKIVDGYGSTPVAPPGGDFMTAMGRTNDAILFGGQVHLFVDATDEEAKDLAEKMPSNTSSDYGRPFADIFKSYEYDFFKIDGMLFSPGKVIVTSTKTGKSFTAGELNQELLNLSFGL